jgi:hypothetical protein
MVKDPRMCVGLDVSGDQVEPLSDDPVGGRPEARRPGAQIGDPALGHLEVGLQPGSRIHVRHPGPLHHEVRQSLPSAHRREASAGG